MSVHGVRFTVVQFSRSRSMKIVISMILTLLFAFFTLTNYKTVDSSPSNSLNISASTLAKNTGEANGEVKTVQNENASNTASDDSRMPESENLQSGPVLQSSTENSSSISISVESKNESSQNYLEKKPETKTEVSVNDGPIESVPNGRTQRYELEDGTKVRMRLKADVDSNSNNSMNITVNSETN